LYKDNLAAKNWKYGSTTAEKYRLDVFSNSIKYNLTTCALQTPFVNKGKDNCFDCPPGLTFNLGTRLCEGCPAGYDYSESVNACVNGKEEVCENGMVYNYTTQTCEEKKIINNFDSLCPEGKPFWNDENKICEVCPSDSPFFNENSLQCEGCPIGSFWNTNKLRCLV
jgi:hypothetical protein